MPANRNATPTRWKLAYLAGAMFMFAGIVEFLPMILSRNAGGGHRAISLIALSLGAMFVAVGSMWLAIGAMWKRKAGA